MRRVCYLTGELACNLGQLDESVGINSVERFLGDYANQKGWDYPKPESESGKKVLIIGAGPAGLSCAYHLRRMGHSVTVLDSTSQAVGIMRYGIPRHLTPRAILD